MEVDSWAGGQFPSGMEVGSHARGACRVRARLAGEPLQLHNGCAWNARSTVRRTGDPADGPGVDYLPLTVASSVVSEGDGELSFAGGPGGIRAPPWRRQGLSGGRARDSGRKARLNRFVSIGHDCGSEANMSNDDSSPAGRPRLLLQAVRKAIQVRRYSPRTAEAYCGWIRRFCLFHKHYADQPKTEGGDLDRSVVPGASQPNTSSAGGR